MSDRFLESFFLLNSHRKKQTIYFLYYIMYLCVFRRDATSINNFVRFLEHFFRERGGNTNIYMSYNHFSYTLFMAVEWRKK